MVQKMRLAVSVHLVADLLGIEEMDLMLATGALEMVVEIGISKGHPMEDEKLALSRLKAALGVTV